MLVRVVIYIGFVVCVLLSFEAQGSDFQLQSGLMHYKNLEFAKARKAFETYLQNPKISKAEKVKALRHLVVCYYNENQKSQAKDVWRQTLQLDSKAQLPPGQSPEVKKFFASIKRPKSRSTSKITKKREGFRHTASVIVLGLAVATAGVAIPFGVMSQQSAQGSLLEQPDAPGALKETEAAQTNATIATVMWVAGGVLLATGVTIFVVELASRKQKPQAKKAALVPRSSSANLLLTQGLP